MALRAGDAVGVAAGTMWNTPFWKLVLAIAWASAELMLPSRKLT
jgi:hypothetical protein